MEKRSKGGVQYSYGMKESHCGNCKFFMETALGLGECKKVKGVISWNMWCKLFRRRVQA